ALTNDVLKEVQLVAKKEGVFILDEHLEQIKQTIAKLPFKGKTSMFQDFEAGRKSENAFFTLTIVEKAKKYSIQVPVCKTLYRIAETMEYIEGYDKRN
ncbi:MAG: ketopantoate reductase C-terminal domain-containing protein, partial [Sphaerochaetaceae bacterium]|nr:ketopantoate reductase C-terminal domain-containing protein [Sphaerochaetaceae bacterium]